jgi:thiamine-phosphate pyrophosphorylase
MDARLFGWARAVKARRGRRAAARIPPLWLFTDATRLPDPLPAVARLPRGAAGVVFRHDGAADRAALGRRLGLLCRRRRLVLVIAGDVRLAAGLGVGVHLRAGRWPGPLRSGRLVTSSAHGEAELRRARRAGAAACFLSPAFATASHPGAPALGALRWTRLARQAAVTGTVVLALGGIDAKSVRRLPLGPCAGAGAIGAFT